MHSPSRVYYDFYGFAQSGKLQRFLNLGSLFSGLVQELPVQVEAQVPSENGKHHLRLILDLESSSLNLEPWKVRASPKEHLVQTKQKICKEKNVKLTFFVILVRFLLAKFTSSSSGHQILNRITKGEGSVPLVLQKKIRLKST